MARRRGRYSSISVDVDIDVDEVIGQLSDEDIVDELVERKLIDVALKRAHQSTSKPVPGNAGERLDEIQADLMARRRERAENDLVKFIDDLIGRDLIAALDAIRSGQIGEAICRIESYRRPSPAAIKSEDEKRAVQ